MLDENIETNWVIDASFTAPLFIEAEVSSTIDGFYNMALKKEHRLFTPALWWFEVSNVMHIAIKRQRLQVAQIDTIVQFINQFDITIEPVGLTTRCFELAQQYHLSAYDAAYLDLAIQRRAALASLDKQLNKAAQEAGIVIW